ncbi:hypothetical protein MUK42_31771 [Musa troglodytarum]|uniref:Thylakoid membrane protein slr0575 n=1 Tax=Musa troglodytarum TaxID=320322 RepID=A0A9E7JVX4_9LILI|nr:hypothetical protein MUK42_31771 [Musa troglodytarum]
MSIAGAAAAATCSLPRLRRAREVVIIPSPSPHTSSRLLSSDWRRSPAGRVLVPGPPPPTPRLRRARLLLVASAMDSTQPSSSSAKTVVPDNEFSVSKVSFGVIGLAVGGSLLSYGFGAYFSILPGSEWSALMLTYGFPLAIIGMALKASNFFGKAWQYSQSLHYLLSSFCNLGHNNCLIQKEIEMNKRNHYAELKPVPCITYSNAEVLRERCATPILKQVRSDVTRYRYGDEQHLDEALKRIFQYGQGGGIPRRSAPTLQTIREEVTEDGKYCLVLGFEAKALKLSDFEQRQAKFTSFFGPGIIAEIGKGEADLYEVRLISQTT